MRSYLPLLSLVSLALSADAPIQSDSQNQQSLIARFTRNSQSEIEGHVEFEPTSNGSVRVSVELNGLPSTGGPFPYHIHEAPVPADGNCTGTLAHFNPFNGSATATTDAAKEVGDLAGRNGNITSESFSTEYVDPYLSLNPESRAYFGGLSVVIHSSNNSRLACANITEEETNGSTGGTGGTYTNATGGAGGSNTTGGAGGANTTGGTGTGSGSTTSSSSTSSAVSTANGVGQNEVSLLVGALAGAAALLI
ncbi:unnamed protein product [Candida verbasci]|uniref:superoxide dismutase n=1 Tax=Candida verbasci TaxID=1227364 RepID=A0A9W4X8K2_9ASCO|nr:unnamed protein product [Candida verbasci]